MESKLSIRHWLTFIIAGLVGQFAWTIENMYLNRYVFYATSNYNFIAPMVASSAVAATLTTLLMGALSDRYGKRKFFISVGYILWGISIIAFSFFNPKFISNITFIGVMIVVLDCIMTFFGSTANDAAFNAYVTDVTNTKNRGKVESVISILPLIAMLIMFGLCDGLVQGSDPKWILFYCIFGGITMIVGIVCLFLIPKDVATPNREEPYFKNIFYGFRPKVIKNNPMLYIVLIAFCVFNIGIQVYYPYFIVYVEHYLGITEMNFTLTLGSVLLGACIITVVFGLFMDKIGKNRIMIPALLVNITGAILMFFARDIAFIIPAGMTMMTGHMVSISVLGAKIRDYTPEKEVGLFQGVRMIFGVAIPMVTGPYIGQALYSSTVETYVNEYGQTVATPNQYIFLGAAIVMVFAIIPLLIIIFKDRKNGKQEATPERVS